MLRWSPSATRPHCCLFDAPWQVVLEEEDVIDVAGVGYEPEGEFTMCGRPLASHSSHAVAALLEAACLCNNAVLGGKEAHGVSDMR